MKKIIIIDDVPGRTQEYEKQFSKWQDIIGFQGSFDNLFQFDKKLDELRLLPAVNEYEYIFIHDSYSYSDLTTNWKKKLKQSKVGIKLFFFSGGRSGESSLERKEIDRKLLFDNLERFLIFSRNIDEFYLLALFEEDYRRRFVRSKYNQIRELVKNVEIVDTTVFAQIAPLLHINYDEVKEMNQNKLLELIDKKIKLL